MITLLREAPKPMSEHWILPETEIFKTLCQPYSSSGPISDVRTKLEGSSESRLEIKFIGLTRLGARVSLDFKTLQRVVCS